MSNDHLSATFAKFNSRNPPWQDQQDRMEGSATTAFFGNGALSVTSGQDPNGLTRLAANDASDSHSTTNALVGAAIAIVVVMLLGSLFVAFRYRSRQKAGQSKATKDLEASAGAIAGADEDHIEADSYEDEKADWSELPTIVVTSQSMLDDIEGEMSEDVNVGVPHIETAHDPLNEETSQILAKVASIAENMQKSRSIDSLVMTIRSVISQKSSILVDSCVAMAAHPHQAETFILDSTFVDHEGMQRSADGTGMTSFSYDEDSTLESLPPPTPNQKSSPTIAIAILDVSMTTPGIVLGRLPVVHESIEDQEMTKQITHEVVAGTQPVGRKLWSAVRNMPTFLSYDDLLPEPDRPLISNKLTASTF